MPFLTILFITNPVFVILMAIKFFGHTFCHPVFRHSYHYIPESKLQLLSNSISLGFSNTLILVF
jgi:hypothetical protein